MIKINKMLAAMAAALV